MGASKRASQRVRSCSIGSSFSSFAFSSSSSALSRSLLLAGRDERPERAPLEAVDQVHRVLVAGELEGRRQQLLAEAVRDELRGDQVHRRHELLEVVVADDQPLEAELVAAPLDLRVRVLRDRESSSSWSSFSARTNSAADSGLKIDRRVAGRLQPEVGLERDPSRRDREELLLNAPSGSFLRPKRTSVRPNG